MKVTKREPDEGGKFVFGREGLQALIDRLASEGFRVLGPALRDGAIVYDDVSKVSELPSGYVDQQEAGRYRLEHGSGEALFSYVVGPQSWKRFLFPPKETLWRAKRDGESFALMEEQVKEQKLAFIGLRSCDLQAIAIQDKVFCDGPFKDVRYAERRSGLFTLAVNCAEPGGTCFCASMDTGPSVRSGFDIALTELINGDGQRFVAEAGSEAGARLLGAVPASPAGRHDLELAAAAMDRAAGRMGRRLETEGVKEALQGAPRHPHWEEVAQRCLACANCTMVCPTCFCVTVEDHTDLSGMTADRVRRWDSCFTLDHSYIHGGSVRPSIKARYRQWLTHKLASWIDQYGVSGCVGCGRCITWCPARIDITEEVAAIRMNMNVRTEDNNGRA
jgi:formate hydrogenlyase subunit 6/NADH:ubiquinone oxidoreductase subunit I